MPTASRYEFLDALRGIAALFVVWKHASERIPLRWPDAEHHGGWITTLASGLNFGSIGVVIFFLISGFVIPFSFKEHPAGRPGDSSGAIRAFVARRFFRLYPLFWLSMLQALAFLVAVGGALPPVRKIVANITMVPGFFGQTSLSGMYWTLQMEVVFYGLCILLFRLGRLRDGRVLLALSLALQGAFIGLWMLFRAGWLGNADPDFIYLPYILALMFIGSLCRRAFEEGMGSSMNVLSGGARLDLRRLWMAAIPWLGFSFLLPVLSLLGMPVSADPVLLGGGTHFGIGHLLGALFFALGGTLFFKLGAAGLRRPVRALVGLGLISYSLYLFHGFGIDLVVWLVEDSGIPGLQGRSTGFYLALMVATGIVTAAILYRCVEKPSIALGRRISGRILRGPSASANF